MRTTDDLRTTVERLAMVVRCAHLKRALTAITPHPSLNFWRLIYGMLLDVAVLEWCKLFGADPEPTHWKRIVADQQQFRSDLLATLGTDEARWADYRKHMKTYRDMQVAHHKWDLSVLDSYPDLTLAIESSYFYYRYVVAELRGLGVRDFPDDLRDYCQRYLAQAREVGGAALAATASFTEQVD